MLQKSHSMFTTVCTLEGANSSTSGIMGYFVKLLKYQDFWHVKSMLKELYCVSEAPLVVLKCELQFVRGDLGFPRDQRFSLC